MLDLVTPFGFIISRLKLIKLIKFLTLCRTYLRILTQKKLEWNVWNPRVDMFMITQQISFMKGIIVLFLIQVSFRLVELSSQRQGCVKIGNFKTYATGRCFDLTYLCRRNIRFPNRILFKLRRYSQAPGSNEPALSDILRCCRGVSPWFMRGM